MNLINKKILIIGGSGLLGSALCDLLNKKGIKFWAPRSSEMNVLNKEYMDGVFNCYRPDVVFNLFVEFYGIIGNTKHPGTVFYNNLIGNMNVIEACKKWDVKKLVQISSQCVYSDKNPTPFKESDIWEYGLPNESNKTYGISKRVLHTMLEAYKQEFGLNSIILIPSNIYGPNDNFHHTNSHVIPSLINRFVNAKENNLKKVEVWGDGLSKREFLYSKDAAIVILLATENYNSTNPINIGSGKQITIKDLVYKLKKIICYDGEIFFNNNGINGQRDRISDVSLSRELFNFEAVTNIDDGLIKTVQWYLENKNLENLRK